MSGIKLGSNISALLAAREQDRLAQNLGKISLRLASGMRINSASDDAAGLSIASSLRANAAVYGQAIRNANDAISATGIAEGSLQELSNILVRLRELATQSASGVYSAQQRAALHAEAGSLTDEFNRITQSTEFNGLKLLDGSLGSAQIQLGYGDNGSISVQLGEDLKRVIGNGNFNPGQAIAGGSAGENMAFGDINGDGIMDYVRTNPQATSRDVQVMIGKGDGTFTSTLYSYGGGEHYGNRSVALGDLDNDGDLDLVFSGVSQYATETSTFVLRNTGGTFSLVTSFGSLGASQLAIDDIDGDGNADIVSSSTYSGGVQVTWGNGSLNPNFGARTTLSASAHGNNRITIADVNEDGRKDIVGASGSATLIALSTGSRSFGSTTLADTTMYNTRVADFDYDGHLDLVGYNISGAVIDFRRGRGDGSFASSQSTGFSGGLSELGDVNGDGKVDVVSYFGGTLKVALNDGRGNLTAGATVSGIASANFRLKDMTGDGVLDVMGSSQIFIGRSVNSTTMQALDLSTRQNALDSLAIIDQTETKVRTQLGSIGAATSRLQSALSNLSSLRLNTEAAHSRIVDADIAAESAELVKLKIRQNITAAVQGQANFMPRLALMLLSS